MNWQAVLVQIVSAVILAGGLTAVVGWLRRARTAPMDNAARLSDAVVNQLTQMQGWVTSAHQSADEARQDADDARREADDTRRELSDTRRQATELRRMMQELSDRWQRVALAIHDPAITLAELRAMVPPPA